MCVCVCVCERVVRVCVCVCVGAGQCLCLCPSLGTRVHPKQMYEATKSEQAIVFCTVLLLRRLEFQQHVVY